MMRQFRELCFYAFCFLLAGFGEATAAPSLVQLAPATAWEPVEFRLLEIPPASNVFDPDVVRVDVAFTAPSGRVVEVPAFWFQDYERRLAGGSEKLMPVGDPGWRVRFTPLEPGTYQLRVTVLTNGALAGLAFTTHCVVTPGRKPPGFGFARVSGSRQYLETSIGEPLRLIGHNTCWHHERGTFDYDEWFTAMQKAGENFGRIWMWPTAFGLETEPKTLTRYRLDRAWQLDRVVQTAQERGIYILLCFDYHGMFEEKPDFWNSNNMWVSNPYNAANGGPCTNQNAFFTDNTARRLYQKRLRYLVARYGFAPNLLAWQFFNEIDNVYKYLKPADVAAWHKNMASWLHQNDPFGHLVTTSLTGGSDRPEIWQIDDLDFAIYHSYNEADPANRLAQVAQSFQRRYKKPVMIGEFGTDWRGWDRKKDPQLRGFRQGVWGGALGGSLGTSMSWWWESIHAENLYSIYAALGEILRPTDWGRGAWTNTTFVTKGDDLVFNAIGLRNSNQALIYLTAPGTAFPSNATNSNAPLQNGLRVLLTNWPSGQYAASWYDPMTAKMVGKFSATATNGSAAFKLPDFKEDLVGVVKTVDR